MGRPITPSGITKIEKGQRRVDVDDLVALSVALGVNPSALLLLPVADSSPIEVTGAGVLEAYQAWTWADGKGPLGWALHVGRSKDREELDELMMDFQMNARPRRLRLYKMDGGFGDRDWANEFGLKVPDDEGDRTHYTTPGGAHMPESQPVVAGIVTSTLGVLIGRRRDGKPPWTFIAGEIEPGESPADAVVREVKEETGLRVVAAEREIGRRVHPKTGRTMIYLACSPVGKTDVHVGDPEELSEVRWVGLAEAEQLLPGLFEPVREHLAECIADDAAGQG